MTIQFNTDKNLTLHEEFRNTLQDQLKEELNRFSENISRLEIHFSDQNGVKEGRHDKKCLIEARIEGRQPIAVTAVAANYELAIDGATDKLKSSLETIFGQMSNH